MASKRDAKTAFGSLIAAAKQGPEERSEAATVTPETAAQSPAAAGVRQRRAGGAGGAAPPIPADAQLVNLSLKVPLEWRAHWVASAKLEHSTLTAAVIEALAAKYGLPK